MAEPAGVPEPLTPLPGFHRAGDVGAAQGPLPLLYSGEPRLVPNNNALMLGTSFRSTQIGTLLTTPSGPTFIDTNFDATAAANASPYVEDRWWLSQARNQAEFDAMATYSGLRRDDRARAMANPLTHMFFTAALDPTSYVMPGTAWMRGGLTVAQRFVRGAVIGSTMVGPSELLRSAVDPSVPMSEAATATVGAAIMMGLVGSAMRPTRPLATALGRYLDGVTVDAAALGRDEGAMFMRSDALAGEPVALRSSVTFGAPTGEAALVEPGRAPVPVQAERPIAARPAHELTLGGEGLLPPDSAATDAAVAAARTNEPFHATLFRGVNVRRTEAAASRALTAGEAEVAAGANTLGPGTYLGVDLKTARGYAGVGGNVQAVDVTLNHPFVFDHDSLPELVRHLREYTVPAVSPEVAAAQLAEETTLQAEQRVQRAHVRTFKLSDEIAAVEDALKDPGSIERDHKLRQSRGLEGPDPIPPEVLQRSYEKLNEHLDALKKQLAEQGDVNVRIQRQPVVPALRTVEARTKPSGSFPTQITDVLRAAGYDGLVLRASAKELVRDIHKMIADPNVEEDLKVIMRGLVAHSGLTHEHPQVVVFDMGRAGIALGAGGQRFDARIEIQKSFFGLRQTKKTIPPPEFQTIGRLAPGDDWGIGARDIGPKPLPDALTVGALDVRRAYQIPDSTLSLRAAQETENLGLMRYFGMDHSRELGLVALTGKAADEAAAAAAGHVAALSPEARAAAVARIAERDKGLVFTPFRPEGETTLQKLGTKLDAANNELAAAQYDLDYANRSLAEKPKRAQRQFLQEKVAETTARVAELTAARDAVKSEIQAEIKGAADARKAADEAAKAALKPETPPPGPDLHAPTGEADAAATPTLADAQIAPTPVAPHGLAAPSAGAAGTPANAIVQSGEYQPLPTGIGLERLKMTPLMRLITSPIDFVGEAVSKLTQIPFTVERNLIGKANPANVTSDQLHWTQRLAHVTQDYDEAFLRHRGVGQIRATVQDLRGTAPAGKMNEAEFGSAVWERLHSQTDHAVPEVNEAAASMRKLYDELGDAATQPDVNFFPAASVRAAKTWQTSAGPISELYVNRQWNRVVVEQTRPALEQKIEHWLSISGGDPRNASDIVDGILTDRPFRAIDDEHVGKATSTYQRAFDAPSTEFARWLITDPKELLSHYVRTMGVDISLMRHAGAVNAKPMINGAMEEWFKAIGNQVGTDGQKIYSILEQRLERIGEQTSSDYKALDQQYGGLPPLHEIAAVRDAGMAQKTAALESARTALQAPDASWGRMNQDLDDLRAARDLLRGTYGQWDDTRDWIPRVLASARKIAMMTGLTGIASQLSDVGALVLKEGMTRTFGTALAVLNGGLDLAKIGLKEAQLYGTALDMMNGGRVVAMGDLAADIGGRHTMTERVIDKATQASFFLNMMNQWNTFIKGWASLVVMHRVADDVDVIAREALAQSHALQHRLPYTGQFEPEALARLARSGIDPDMAVAISNQLAGHQTIRNGLRLPNTETWAHLDARTAYRRAVAEDVDNAIVSGDKIGRSLYLSRPIGQTIGMFQGYGQAVVQKLMIPALQQKDSRVLAGVALMVGAGVVSDSLRRSAIGDNRPYTPSEVLMRGIDRSGVFGWFGQLYNAASGMFDNRYGPGFAGAPHQPAPNLPAGLVPSPDGLVRALGPVASRARDLVDLTYRTATMGWGRETARDARRLLPLNNVTHLHFAFTQLERMMAGAGHSEPAVQYDTRPRAQRNPYGNSRAAAAAALQPAAPETVAGGQI